jgi:GNAT superfamily N-acetyltransferase
MELASLALYLIRSQVGWALEHHTDLNAMQSSASRFRINRTDDQANILATINAAAQRYRGAIPADCWHEPYMTSQQLRRDISSGVCFWGCEDDAAGLIGVMGIQHVKHVTLVRHAYVRPECQGMGVGSVLLRHLETLTDQRILIGTWADAAWAIRFYQTHGYTLISQEEVPALLRTYWDIPQRQIETSVVLAKAARSQESPEAREKS